MNLLDHFPKGSKVRWRCPDPRCRHLASYRDKKCRRCGRLMPRSATPEQIQAANVMLDETGLGIIEFRDSWLGPEATHA